MERLLIGPLGAFFDVCCLAIAALVVIYGSLTRRRRPGYIASLIGLGFALASLAVGFPLERYLLAGCCVRGGDPYPAWMMTTNLVVMCAQAITIAAALLNAMRHRAAISTA